MDADVGIVGVGTMGSMAMWQLARSGVFVIGFEQFGTGHDRSAAGGESRIFRTAYLEGAEYVPLLQESYRQWLQLEEETGKQLLTINGGLMIGAPNSQNLRNVLKSIETFGLDHEVLNEQAAQSRFPQLPLLPGEIAVLDKQAGIIRPEYAVVSAIQRAEELGAVVYRQTPVEKIQPEADGVIIQANGSRYKVGKLLMTTGPWTGTLLPNYQQQLTTRRIVMTWFAAKDITQYTPDRFPIFIRDSQGIEFFGMPSVENSMVKVALASTYGDVGNPDDLHRTVHPQELTTIHRVVRDFLPGLLPDPVRVSVYMDVYTPDGDAIVGYVPGFANTIVLSGFSGHGFKLAPVMGKIAAELVLDGKTEHPIEHLSPSRFVNTTITT